MGNAGSNQPKEWSKDHHSKHIEAGPSSPTKDGEAFTFDKKTDENRCARDDDINLEEDTPLYTKSVPELEEQDEEPVTRNRSNTLTESNKNIEDVQVLPTVFKWEGGGKQVQCYFIESFEINYYFVLLQPINNL